MADRTSPDQDSEQQREEQDTAVAQSGSEQPEGRTDGDDKSEAEKAEEVQERYDKAREKVAELEDDPPKDLSEWPDDEAKYITFGGGEGDHGYDEGPEKNLGPSSVQYKEDGKVVVDGEEVDDPDEFKGEPIPGGPTDPDTPETHGEKRKKEKMERMYGESPGGSSESDDDDEQSDSDSDDSDDSGDSGDSGDSREER